MTTLIEDVAAAVEELFAGQAVGWSDPPDIRAELEAVWLPCPELTAARVMSIVLRLAYEVDTLTDLTAAMHREGITRVGQEVDGQTCGALLDLADRLEEWRDGA